MNKNSIIGLVLIGCILFGFSWYQSKQFEKQVAQQAQTDSLARIQMMEQMALDSLAAMNRDNVSSDKAVAPSVVYKDESLGQASAGEGSIVKLRNGQTGSVTFIGTVSPAGGNLKEPVTESTKKAARCFYALEQSRADQKRYPSINPIESYSKYLEYPEIKDYLDEKIEKGWAEKVNKAKN